MREYLDTMNNRTADIQEVACALKTISGAFYVTGNNVQGKKLSCFAEILFEACEEINNAVSKELTDRVNESQQSAYNTVAACLAMTVL